LTGQSKHTVNATSVNYQSEKKYRSNLDDKSLAFRVGYKYTDYLTFEFAKHDHGSVTNKVELIYSTQLPGSPDGNPCCLGPDHDTVVTAIIPIEIDSLRLGVKVQWQLLSNLSINARLGIARWEFEVFSPKHLTFLGSQRNEDVSGNDLYYGVSAEYQFTENFYLGIEYSILSIKESYSDANDVSGSYNYDIKDLSLVLGWAF
jgi:opacity protein-like surface antigen